LPLCEGLKNLSAASLREGLAEAPVALPGGGSLALTASVGVAVAAPGERFADAVRRADGALYAAKAAGRNRVALA
jgi:two-component system cell cycle response regulator